MKAKIFITLKEGVLDPQGKAIAQSLNNLGFIGINDVRQGRLIEIDIDKKNSLSASEELEKMCQKLLANTVIEDYKIEIT
jgi:phosphoribosylformylglycinamidine synthase, purS protein